MSAPRLQRCEYCGEVVGTFAHSRRNDGPLSCSSSECSREAARDERDEARAEYEYAQEAAAADDYGRYR